MSTDTNDRKAPESPDLLAKTYEPHALEGAIYAAWEQAGYFAPAADGESYCIMLPPPNVTGSLHMGHAFQHTLMDALVRYRRMRGASALWQGGTDHAGIATQMVVERQLAGEGKSRHDLGREPFLKRVWEWKAQSGGRITEQMRRLGTAVDWSRERFTMDPGLSRAVTEVFVRLHEEGLIYRGKRLVNWDPVLHTAVSDLEVVSEEEAGHLWHIKYPLASGAGHLVVATTRPETLLGDAAVAVHPDDERYRGLVGQQVILPLTGRTIPVIADTYVDKEFGSGCVKITPAHDFNDYEVGKRHDLEAFNIFTVDAKIIGDPGDLEWAQKEHDYRAPIETGGTLIKKSYQSLTASDIPVSYRGLDRFEARKRMVADLAAQGLIDKIEDHKLKVPRGDRTHAVIEPYLTDQWYVKIAPLAQPAIRAVEEGRIKFIPENWAKTYYDWMHNIQDWCISRQIWWGHRIPAWYDDEGRVYVGRNEAEVRAKHNLGTRTLRQDDDVLDTWFSSALWPFSTLGWPAQTPELKKFYPTSVLVTGFDIIFFWVARMIMLGLKFMDAVPFREVYVTGLVRDAEGQKMSKSKGNILDPLDLIDGIALDALLAKRTTGLMQPQMAKRIEQATRKQFPQGIPAFGTDALRFTLASLATQGRDIKFDLGRIEGYRNFCNKLWNAARYVLMNTEGRDCGLSDAPRSYTLAERWIWARTAQTVREFEQALAEYRFDLAAQAIYAFIWDEYCSWYLELSKVVLTDANADAAVARGTRFTLVQVLETALRLLHPLMPFITEAIWRKLAPLAGKTGASIMEQSFPRIDAADAGADAEAIAEMAWAMQTITGVRNIRGEMDINPGKPLAALLQGGAQDRAYLERNRHYLVGLARLREIAWLDADKTAPESATALVGQMKVLIPLAGLIDKDAELARLDKDIDALEKNLAREQAKLSNQSFLERAPANVVAEAKARIAAFETQLAQLKGQRERVAAMAA